MIHFHLTMFEDYGVLKCIISIILCFMTVYCESILKCDIEDCGAKYYDPPKIKCTDIPGDAKMKSVNILKEMGRNKCVLDETYGFDVHIVWVSPPCNAVFNICFIIQSDDDTTISPNSPKTTFSTNRPPPLLPGPITESYEATTISPKTPIPTNRPPPPLPGPTTVSFSGPPTRSPKELSNVFSPEIGEIPGAKTNPRKIN